MTDTLRYAMGAYSFLLPIGSSTFADWAELIKQSYCLDNIHNLAVYNEINSTNGTIKKTRLECEFVFESY